MSEEKDSYRPARLPEETSPEPAAPLDQLPAPEPTPSGERLPPGEPPPIPFTFEPPKPPPKLAEPRIRTNIVLFVLTFASSIYWGFLQYQLFYAEELRGLWTSNPFAAPAAFLGGLPFGVAVIAVLLAHEMGHYLACRHYGIAATLPYFLPMPPPNVFPTLLPGTIGAIIRIRGAITSRRALFDIAVAGPIAGWVTALPILAYGLSQSRVVSTVEIETSGAYLTLGEPLLWEPMSRLFGPEIGPSQDLIMHPLAFVGWFALLITAMNLLPVGQLDGGHLLYSLLPRWHRALSFTVLALMLFAGFLFSPVWIPFAVLVSVLFMMGGFGHPPLVNADQSLGAARTILTVLTVAIFVTSFMLVPVRIPPIFFR
ncbi:MAG: site-2 protease family protein [Acidobacteria bacterium]|nr:site-2 protease family protein [Acidobacteriota bacterium]